MKLTASHASRSRRLHEKRRQAVARDRPERAAMYLRLHRFYVAMGMSEMHREMGSYKTALDLWSFAMELRSKG